MKWANDTDGRTLGLLQAIAEKAFLPFTVKARDTRTKTLRTVEQLAKQLGILPYAPGDMATVTKSIGTTSRDYSTISSWEADLDNGAVYASGDDAVGECYNDSAFDETVVINGGGTIGLSSRKLSVPSAERHDGTAGIGARIVRTGNGIPIDIIVATDIEWLEIDVNGNGNNTMQGIDLPGSTSTAKNCLVHDIGSTFGIADGLRCFESPVLNCIVYDIDVNAGGGDRSYGIRDTSSSAGSKLNCTVYNVTKTGGTGEAVGIENGTTTGDVKNCISMDTGGTTTGAKDDFQGGTQSYNLSSDSTASGTGSLTSKTSANQFVSTTGGSEDLHLKSGADAIDAGTDLGTTPSGVEIDIDGRDRDAEADTWDIGAHEFVAAGGAATSSLLMLLGVGS